MKARAILGPGSIAAVERIVEGHGARRVLLVAGARSFELSGAAQALRPLLTSKRVQVARFSGFGSYPRIEDVVAGLELARSFDPDLVLAVGGGTAIDVAKLVNAVNAHEGECLAYVTGALTFQRSPIPLIAVPTTAGTGSEATHFAVAYIGHKKFAAASPHLLPRYAIVDPDLTRTLSAEATATTGLDALSQAIESYWAVGATEESKRDSAEAIREILPSILPAVRSPNPEIRWRMARGAHLSGRAINVAKTTGPHALSYWLTSKHGIPHGLAVFLSLGAFFLINARDHDLGLNEPRGTAYLRRTMSELYTVLGCAGPSDCATMLRELLRELGLPATFGEVGISATRDIEEVVNAVNLERMGNNPVKVTRRVLHETFV